jgi:hypothetical protein
LAHCFEISGSIERVATTEKKGDKVSGHIATCDIEAAGKVVEDNGLVYGNNVSDTVARVNYDS